MVIADGEADISVYNGLFSRESAENSKNSGASVANRKQSEGG